MSNRETGQTMSHRRPTFVATSVLVAGVLASLAGNLQAINLDNAAPGVGAHVSAIFWPAILFGTVELLIHTPWLSNWRDRLTKASVVLLVAAVAAWVSYWHLANVLSHYGYDVASRYAGPLAIDAAMVLATLALNRVGHARRATVQDVGQATVQSFQYALPIGPMPLASVQVDTPVDTDILQDTVEADRQAAEVDIFARLASEMDIAEPTLPVPVSSAPAAAARKASLTDTDSQEARSYATVGRRHGLAAGEIARLLAGQYGVSDRTIRRQPWWTEATRGLASEAA
jgi:hypothetical protein